MIENFGQHENNIDQCTCEDKILIVDDNSFNLIPLEMLLENNFSIKVDTAMNGKIAVDMF